jgi:hypothetical protein
MSDKHEGSKWSDKDAFGVPFHIDELKALHPDTYVCELDEKVPLRFVVVVRQQIDEKAATKFVNDFHARGIEVVVFCLGNAKANANALPEECIFGNVSESM